MATHNSEDTRTAGERVYGIGEIRSRILDLVDKPTLSRCMSVTREGMYDVSKRLYHTISYNQAQLPLSFTFVSLPLQEMEEIVS